MAGCDPLVDAVLDAEHSSSPSQTRSLSDQRGKAPNAF
ncbi:hypothetical protein SynA1528_02068 [Synechococcus sp. A15-28]|nr:hypothetical protein SynA1528_02068 [Synechococcus sp. A15-28]